jgi:L-threonylcarbamoyladenylate synthase
MKSSVIAQKICTKGALGVIPTDTVYGLVARASDPKSVKRLYELKERDSKPGTLIAGDINQLVELGFKPKYLNPFKIYWPAPLSVIVPTSPGLSYLDLGRKSLAIRIPANKNLLDLLKITGPLLTSSANRPGESPALTIKEAQAVFKSEVDFYVDGGKLQNKPSTIIRVIDDAVEIVRQGDYRFRD